MATTWLPKNNFTRRSFLLANGDVVLEPELEETATGLKIRLAGTKTSYFSKDKETLVRKGLDIVASQRQTQYWMPIDLDEAALTSNAGFQPANTQARFDPLVKKGTKATAWWSFKHASMPVEALLYLRWQNPNGYEEGNQILGRLVLPNQMNSSLHPDAKAVADPKFSAIEMSIQEHSIRTYFEEFIRDNPPGEWAKVLQQTNGLMERSAVETLLREVRAVEELDEIEIPDLRDPDNPAWLTLKLHDTNVNGQFMQDMGEYLSGTSSVERALELYRDLVAQFRSIGMVMEADLSENQLMAAMLHGDKKALTVKVGTPIDPDESADGKHKVSVHLPTGTFMVSCSHQVEDKDKIAHAWDESLLLATLTGKKDVLLAYAERYVETEHERRTSKTIGRRVAAMETHVRGGQQ